MLLTVAYVFGLDHVAIKGSALFGCEVEEFYGLPAEYFHAVGQVGVVDDLPNGLPAGVHHRRCSGGIDGGMAQYEIIVGIAELGRADTGLRSERTRHVFTPNGLNVHLAAHGAVFSRLEVHLAVFGAVEVGNVPFSARDLEGVLLTLKTMYVYMVVSVAFTGPDELVTVG